MSWKKDLKLIENFVIYGIPDLKAILICLIVIYNDRVRYSNYVETGFGSMQKLYISSFIVAFKM